MGEKAVIRELLDRSPDDCTLNDVIEEITKLEGPWLRESDLRRFRMLNATHSMIRSAITSNTRTRDSLSRALERTRCSRTARRPRAP